MIKNKLIIFDLDGTLYKFKNGSFINSGLQKKVLKNALSYIQKKLKQSKSQAKNTLKIIQEEYGEDISIALEEKYGCSRQDYFDEVWNISAKGIITGDKSIKNILLDLAKKNKLLLVSDGAKVWVKNALEELNIKNIFEENILSGDGEKRKSLGNRFGEIPRRYNFSAKDIVVIGDQEKTDIIPAKKAGFKTVFIGKKQSKFADANINNIKRVVKAIESIF